MKVIKVNKFSFGLKGIFPPNLYQIFVVEFSKYQNFE